MSNDETVTGIILARLERIEAKLDRTHERTQDDVVKLYDRMREVERAQAEGRGKLVVIVAILTSAAGLLFEWIGKHLT